MNPDQRSPARRRDVDSDGRITLVELTDEGERHLDLRPLGDDDRRRRSRDCAAGERRGEQVVPGPGEFLVHALTPSPRSSANALLTIC